MVNVLFSAQPEAWASYEPHLKAALDAVAIEASIVTQTSRPQDIDYIVYAPNADLKDFGPFTNAKAVLNLWAGVEDIVGNETLRIPLCRMVGGGLTESMIEWVCGHVLRYHLGMDAHINGQDGIWRNDIVAPVAAERQVCILGIGALGAACGHALTGLGFKVSGWSRSQKQIDSITCHSGVDGLKRALSSAEIVITLLPSTPETENVLNADTLAWMPRGSFIINPGRGPLIEDDALLAALDRGHIAHATLDVFRQEPLPEEHPFWAHPQVTVTPHIASATRPSMAVHVIAENIARGEAGQPFLHVVDRDAGY